MIYSCPGQTRELYSMDKQQTTDALKFWVELRRGPRAGLANCLILFVTFCSGKLSQRSFPLTLSDDEEKFRSLFNETTGTQIEGAIKTNSCCGWKFQYKSGIKREVIENFALLLTKYYYETLQIDCGRSKFLEVNCDRPMCSLQLLFFILLVIHCLLVVKY